MYPMGIKRGKGDVTNNCVGKSNNFYEIDRFLEHCTGLKRTQEETENSKSPVSGKVV